MGKTGRFRNLRHLFAVMGILAFLLAACGSGENSDTSNQDSSQTDTQTASTGIDSAQPLVAAFEAEGLACTKTDENRLRNGAVEQFECRGDDYIVMTIRDFGDESTRDEQLDRIQGLACDIAESGQDIQRLTTSGSWIVMAGGDRDVDFEVFGNAMTSLNLDWDDYTC